MLNRVFSSSMRRMSLALGLALVLLWVLGGVFSTTTAAQSQPIGLTRSLSVNQAVAWYVAPPPLGNDANDCASGATPCATIQHAIDVANDGDQVLIASGLYTQSVTLYKPVSLTGVNSATTIIHATAGQRVLTVTGATISNSVVVSGLTFTGGSADYGGGMLITDTAQPLIRAAIFLSNAASINGGGIYAQSDLTLMDSRIISNVSVDDGGGVYAVRPLTVTASEFSDNRGILAGPSDWSRGGGLYAQMETQIVDSRFTYNSSAYGGGLYTVGSNLILTDTDFSANIGGGAIAGYLYTPCEVNISGGGFFSNTNAGLSVIGPLHMTGTQILGNSGPAPLLGAGVGIYDGPATIVNSRFENNRCSEADNCDAGGLSFYRTTGEQPLLLISNTLFISNSHGGVSVNEGRVIVVDSHFERNVDTYDGGGMSLWQSSLTVTGSTFISNTGGTLGGGGIEILGPATLINTRFEGNSSADQGGGIYVMGPAYLTNTQFINNTAAVSGGGAFVGNAAYITDSCFEHNTVAGARGWGGGALSGGGGGFFISHTLFLSNTAPDLGGGIMVIGPLVVNDSQFIGNQCLKADCTGGGADLQGGGRGEFFNTIFAYNQGNGTALFLEEQTQTSLRHVTIADNTLNPRPAIAVLSGTLNLTDTIIASHTIAISNTGSTVYEDYNLFFGNLTNTVGVITSGGHSLIGDPKFVDPLHDDYHLRFDSAAIDHGIDAGVYTDLDGNPRPSGAGFDIGAYEYQFAPSNYTLTVAMAGTGSGVVSPTVGTHQYLYGDVVTLTATPLISSTFVGWSGDVSGTSSPITLTMDANKTITATFAINTYVITPTAGANGNITPSTPQAVTYGASQTFTITPNTGYHIANVGVDGVSQGAIDLYAFTNITANHTISAAFAINTYTITPTAGAHGTITPSTPQTVNYGASQTFTITPNTGYHIAEVGVDGISQGPIGFYTFNNVTANHTISAAFAINTFIITPTAGAHGTITPSTPQTVNYGASQTFTITPNTGYHIAEVGVDGISQGSIGLYAFTNVMASHTITAAFALNAPNTYTLTVNYAGNGLGSVTLNPPGPTYIAGTIVTLTATSLITSTFSSWSGDVMTTTNPITVTMTGNKTVTATFALKQYGIYLPLITR